VDASRIAIQRGIAITGATALPDIDVDATGTVLANSRVGLPALDADERSFTTNTLFTAHSGTLLSQSDDATFLEISEPSPGDQQRVEVSVTGPGTSRDTVLDASSFTQEVTLLPRLTGVTFDDTSATWAGIPFEFFDLDFSLADDGAHAHVQHLVATPRWLYAAGNPRTLAFDTSAPGFDPTWRVTNPQDEVLALRVTEVGIVESTLARR
jgi:hypothetical protein